MNPWFAKAVILAVSLALVAIPASIHRRGPPIQVAKSRKGALERALLALASVGFVLPLVWVLTPVLAFADYPLRPIPFAAGVLCLALGLWLLYRSHADLGPNWSITLEVRKDHALVTQGIYRSVRHPMYLALLLYGSGQALALPNWVAGPCYLVAVLLLIAFRLGPEERMMREEFGSDYDAYVARTKRFVPGIW